MEACETILEATRRYERTHYSYMSMRGLYSHGHVPESKYRIEQERHREAADYLRLVLASYEECLRESPGYVFMAVHRWTLACREESIANGGVDGAWAAVAAALPGGE